MPTCRAALRLLVLSISCGLGCGASIERFVVHSGPPKSAGTALPAPAEGTPVVVAADVDPKQSTVQTPSVVFSRTAPDPHQFGGIALPGGGNPPPGQVGYEAVIPAAGQTFPDGTAPLQFVYPSAWTAVVDVPFVTSGPASHLNQFVRFQVTVAPACTGFDTGTEGGAAARCFDSSPAADSRRTRRRSARRRSSPSAT